MEQHRTSHFKLSATSCGTCGIYFNTTEIRRAHSNSQWHVANLKRRIAELEPLTAEQVAATEGSTAPAGPTSADASSEESSSSASDVEVDSEPGDDFVPEQCLFCNVVSEDFDKNITHMHQTHGLFIPDAETLAVDVETLVRYLHLVIHGYNECLQCGTQRRTSKAVQQHMIGKNHCRFNIEPEHSEYRDFYEYYRANEENGDKKEDGDENETERESQVRKAIRDAAEEGGFRSINLPSGKAISHRSAPGPSRPRKRIGAAFDRTTNDNFLDVVTEIDETTASLQLTAPSATGNSHGKALTRAERQENLVETQLARLSANDRAALAHLHAAEQRSVLLAQQKQKDRLNRADRRLQTRLEIKANKTGQGNFVDDVMGSRFSVHLYGSNPTVLETQLARLSVNDRNALAHLPATEQRSVLAVQQKQLEKAERAGRRLQTRLEMKANKTGQGNFVNDVPGRKNG